MSTTNQTHDYSKIIERISAESPSFPVRKQPMHTLYGGAHLFSKATPEKVKEIAVKYFSAYIPNPDELAAIFQISDAAIAQELYEKTFAKLHTACLEDYRVDFEDGYGYRTDEEEDNAAVKAALEAAKAHEEHLLPPFFGFRIKPLTKISAKRSLRTLDIFLSKFFPIIKSLPDNFIITLPKIENIEQCVVFNEVVSDFEKKLNLPDNYIKTELMIELPGALYSPSGAFILPELIKASGPRITGIHFGIYDFTSSIQIPAPSQSYTHAACDSVRFLMQCAGNLYPVAVSDGATSFLPLEIYKVPVNKHEKAMNRDNVAKAWKLHFDNVLHSVHYGIFQGWDLHPSQIPARIAALQYYFLTNKIRTFDRLKRFVEQAAQATQKGGVFDDAATGQGLLNFVRRGYDCGALSEEDILSSGLTLRDISGKTFGEIILAKAK
jgi:citrate lyase beta subunit